MVIFKENPGEISEELPCEIFWKASFQFMENLIKKFQENSWRNHSRKFEKFKDSTTPGFLAPGKIRG